jgi:hypothetical protein
MYGQSGSYTSQIIYPKEAPQQPGGYKRVSQKESFGANFYVWGRYCFAGQTYNLQRDQYGKGTIDYELWTSAKDPAVLVMRVPGRGSLEFPMIKTGPCAW